MPSVALRGRAAVLAQTLSFMWPNAVRPLGERMARLDAMAASLRAAEDAEGKAVVYTPPTPDEVAEAQGRLIADLARGKGITAAELLARRRRDR